MIIVTLTLMMAVCDAITDDDCVCSQRWGSSYGLKGNPLMDPQRLEVRKVKYRLLLLTMLPWRRSPPTGLLFAAVTSPTLFPPGLARNPPVSPVEIVYIVSDGDGSNEGDDDDDDDDSSMASTPPRSSPAQEVKSE